jgi:hypothetical protein
LISEVTTAERFSSTTKLTCRGRLQELGGSENQNGGPGQVQRLDVQRGQQALTRTSEPALPLSVTAIRQSTNERRHSTHGKILVKSFA